ncbi:hypothetical protein HWV03_12930 [Moritella sp. 36]|uniref:hypothetical protein n=1 Tax=Moritella sp. 36 TaxID=2746233 RepID=UPI001BA8821A|nr:hypothetical protein [Moritella sp. 36]QUM89641.1 hypothetical protein HWV03_12930 [Moritella sp. 36]
MKEAIFWKLMLLLLVSSSAWDLYLAFSEPEILQPAYPLTVSIFSLSLDLITVMVCLGLILKKYILNQSFWFCIILVQMANTIIVFYFEFTTGGYTVNEFLIYGNIGLFVATFFMSPLVRYYYLVKKIP